MTPAVSVVIPTHNRRAPVLRLLRALDNQAQIDGGFDAIVVADGCTDGTASAIRSTAWGFDVAVIEQPPSGPAAARNRGAAHASGRILLFLDDDVEPLPDLLRAHAAFHQRCIGAVAVGDLPPAVEASGYFGTCLRGWWVGMYDGARQPGHRYIYRNLLSGHFSIPRASFEAIGGFDPKLRCHEDWELGYRAIEAGLRLQFLPDAVARHHEASTLSKTVRRKYDDGFADVQLIERYPELAADMPLGRVQPRGRVSDALRSLAWSHPMLGDILARAVQFALPAYEVAHLRFRWRARLEDLLDYSYWRGVATAAGSRDALRALLDRAPHGGPPELTIDLAAGLEAAKAALDGRRPRSVRLILGVQHIADVPVDPGAERLRGEHLPRIIVRRCAREYLRAAQAAGIVPPALSAEAPATDAGSEGHDAVSQSPAALAS